MEKSAIFHQSNSQYSYFVSDTRAVVILRTIQAGANAIPYTPPSTGELFRGIMEKNRE